MGYSNWRQELTEVMTDKEDDKKVTEKKVKNKIVINPKLGEAVEALGGELLEMVEMVQPEPEEKEKEDPKQKKISQVKKQVLMKKMQAVRQGAGADIVAHTELEGEQISEGEGAVRYCPACDKDETRDECKAGGEYWDENSKPAKAEDPRGMKTKVDMVRNKLRAMGLKMSHVPEGEMTEAAEDSLRDRRMERGGVDGNTRYDRAPGKPNTFGKKKPRGGSAIDFVKAEIRGKYGKGAIMDTKKK